MGKSKSENITTIHMQPATKERGQKASKLLFGKVNLSGYIQTLINTDCDKKKIK